ncbi:MAG: hypothetical protein ABR568_23870, partial [Pyrinomonadaceae bacterium]
PKDLAPRSETGSGTIGGVRQRRLRSYGAKEQRKDLQAINISPRWGEATDNVLLHLQLNSRLKTQTKV